MDFYVILGVPQEASTADIKRAYRRLARRYHPGVNPGDRAAEECFRRIVEAYETLVDPGRRRQYDTAGMHGGPRVESASFVFSEFDFSAAKRGAQASTFTELFAEVLHPLPRDGPGTRRSWCGSARHADGVVCRRRPRRRASGAGHASGHLWSVRRCRTGGGCRSAMPAVSGRGPDPLGSRAHGVLEAVHRV